MASLLLAAIASAVVVAHESAVQDRPNFTGTWTMDVERSETPNQGTGAEPVTVVITQTAQDVVVETLRGTLKTRTSYVFSSAPTPPAAKPGGPVGRAFWNGDALVMEGTRIVQGQTVSTRETRRLNAAGDEMTVESLLMVQHGYEFRGAKNYGTATDVYRKR